MSNQPRDTQRAGREVRSDAGPPPGAGAFGMGVFLVSLSALFAASIIGYLVVRSRAAAWPPPDMPPLPAGLWVSTLILLGSSVTMHRALRSARRGRQKSLQASMVATTGLGVAFLVSQVLNWWKLAAAQMTASVNLYAFTFYLLTGLHAGHVVGGLVGLGLVTRNAFGGRYSAEDHAGVVYCSMYWHFLDVVWLILFTLIFLVP